MCRSGPYSLTPILSSVGLTPILSSNIPTFHYSMKVAKAECRQKTSKEPRASARGIKNQVLAA